MTDGWINVCMGELMDGWMNWRTLSSGTQVDPALCGLTVGSLEVLRRVENSTISNPVPLDLGHSHFS